MAGRAAARLALDEEFTGTTAAGDRRDPAVRGRLSAPAMRVFLRIADAWKLSVAEQRILLGGPAASTYYGWKAGKVGTLSYDQLERLSLVFGIYKAMRLLFADEAGAQAWLRAPNTDRPFGGQSPFDRLLRGSIDDLYAVRRYLDAWRGVWP